MGRPAAHARLRTHDQDDCAEREYVVGKVYLAARWKDGDFGLEGHEMNDTGLRRRDGPVEDKVLPINGRNCCEPSCLVDSDLSELEPL